MSASSVILSGGAAAFAAPESKDPFLASKPPSRDLPAATKATPAWERIGNYLVLLAYSCVVLFTVRYHEKWADEAQAWLIARDLPLSRIWFYELRYEGSPGLWHTILWVAQHWFHAPYAALGYIGVAFAIAGAAVLIFKAPFPWYVRWPLAFTYVMVYQYAVIARPYTLLPLLCFLVAILFKDIEHPERLTVVLFFLANLTFHGTVLAGCFGFAYLVRAIHRWTALDESTRTRYLFSVAAMVLTFIFLFAILKPTPDVGDIVIAKTLAAVRPKFQTKVVAVISGAFLDFILPSSLFLLLATIWTVIRRQWLTFVLPVFSMIGLYAAVHGVLHHHGTVFIAAVTGLWIAWPTAAEEQHATSVDRWMTNGMAGLLVCLCFLNIWDAEVAVRRDIGYPYSGSSDAAEYLKSLGADRSPMIGYNYGVVAVQPYFDHNLFANFANAFCHQGIPLCGVDLNIPELRRVSPEFVVVAASEDLETMLNFVSKPLNAEGYHFVHFSDGYTIVKRSVPDREVYFIFRRVHPH